LFQSSGSIGLNITNVNYSAYGRAFTGASFAASSFGYEIASGATADGGLLGGLAYVLIANDASRRIGAKIESNVVGTTATNLGANLRFYVKADNAAIAEIARMTASGVTFYSGITATSFVKTGGTSNEYLRADGSVNVITGDIISGSGTAGYIAKFGSSAVIASSNLFESGANIGFGTITLNYGSYGRAFTGAGFGSTSFGFEAVTGSTTNGGLIGGLSLVIAGNDSTRRIGSAIQSYISGATSTHQGADLRFFVKPDNAVLLEVVRMTSAGITFNKDLTAANITATTFVKSGGLSTQFLMADGSVSTLSSPVTGSGSAGYIPKWTTAANIGSSIIYEDISIGIAYTTPNRGGYGRTLSGAAFGSASFGFEAVSNTTTNGGLIGGLSFIVNQNDSSRIVGSAIQSNLVGTTATNYGADLRFFAKADGVFTIAEVARMTSAGLRVYGTIVKDGGTGSQYLMADGSVSTGPNLSSYITGSGTATRVAFFDGTNSIASSSGLFWDNTNSRLCIGTSTSTTARLTLQTNSDADAISLSGYQFLKWNSSNHLIFGGYVANEWAQIKFFAGGTQQVQITTASVNFENSIIVKGIYNVPNSSYFVSGTNGYRFNNSADTFNNVIMYDNGNTYTRGNVLIGTTTDSGFKLDVIGTVRFSGSISLANNNVFPTGAGIFQGSNYIQIVGGTGGFTINNNANTVSNFVITDSGLATFSNSITATQANFTSTANTYAGGALILKQVGGINPVYLTSSGGYFALSNGGTADHLIINSTGVTTFSNSVTALSLIKSGGTSAQFLKADGSIDSSTYLTTAGAAAQYQPIGSYATGSGASSRLARWTSTTNLSVAQIWDDGTNIGIGQAPGAFKLDVTGTGRFSGTLFANASGGQIQIGGGTTTSGIFQGGSNNLFIGDWNTATKGLTINVSTGVSTFTNSVTCGGSLIANTGSGATFRAIFSTTNQIEVGNYNATDGYREILFAGSPISFYTGTAGGGSVAPRMTITAGGSILVGTQTDGGYRFDVAGQIRSFSGTPLVLSMSSNPVNDAVVAARWQGGVGTEMRYFPFEALAYFDNTYPATSGQVFGDIRFRINSGGTMTPVMTIKANNTSVGIGTINPTFTLDVSGTGRFTSSVTATSFFESSDFRLKTLIEHNPIVKGIENLQAKLYEKNGKIELGYFAQDAEKLMPYAVTKNADGFLNLSYREVHTAKIARLEQRVAELEKQLNLN